jgi:hypothetical protein
VKKILSVLTLISLSSCSSLLPTTPKVLPPFDQKVSCTPKSLIYLDQKIQSSKRSVTEKIKAHQRYRSVIKTKLDAAQACYLKEVDLHKDVDYSYNVCMVVELNEEGSVSYLDIEDNSNPLPASVSKCLYDIFEIMEYRKVGGAGVFSQALRFEKNSKQK